MGNVRECPLVERDSALNLDVSQNSHHLLIFDIFTLLPLMPHVCDITGYYRIIP